MKETKEEFELGQPVCTVLAGEEGVVIWIAKYEEGHTQYQIRYKAADGRQVEQWFGSKAIKAIVALLVMLTLMPLLSGCDEVRAASVPAGPVPLWTAMDAQQALSDLRAIREQEKLLLEIRAQTAATNAAIATLKDHQTEFLDQLRQANQSTTNAVAKVSSSLSDLQSDIDGVEQRLDNPVFPPAPPLPSSPPALATRHTPSTSAAPLCVTIAGIDYDIPQLIADWYTIPWSWDGSQDENGLKAHLASHGVTNIDGLPFATLKKVHAAVHEKELAAQTTSVAPGATGGFQLFGDVDPNTNPPDQLAVNPSPDGNSSVNPNSCPNGQCPVVRSKTVTVTRQSITPAPSSSGSVSYQPARYSYTKSVSCSGGRCRVRKR